MELLLPQRKGYQLVLELLDGPASEKEAGLDTVSWLEHAAEEVRFPDARLSLDQNYATLEVVHKLQQQAVDDFGLVLPSDEIRIAEIHNFENLVVAGGRRAVHGGDSRDTLELELLGDVVGGELDSGRAKRLVVFVLCLCY